MKKKMVVAVIDSGVNKMDGMLQEQDIEDIYYEDQEFKTCYVGKLNPHGTEIIKVLLKEAPDIKILSVRTLQADNRCMLSAIIHALEFCIEQKVDVINLSLGSCGSTSSRLKELQQVCERAIQRGIVIFAADNNISGKKSYPANFENVIGVVAPENQKEFCSIVFSVSIGTPFSMYGFKIFSISFSLPFSTFKNHFLGVFSGYISKKLDEGT
jgi:subtilisin family serine protease